MSTPRSPRDERAGTRAEATADVATAAAPAARPTMFADPVVRRMAWAGALVLIAFLATVASALFFGVLNPPAPRTALERDLAIAEATIESAESSATVQDYYEYATALVGSGQYGKAERIIATARDIGFDDTSTQFLAIAEMRLGLAREDFAAALAAADAGIGTLEEQYAADLERFEQTKQASVLVAENMGANYDTLLLGKAEALEQLGRVDDAIAALDTYLTRNQRAADILVWRGDLKALGGDSSGAIADYRAAAPFMPGDEALAEKLADLGASND